MGSGENGVKQATTPAMTEYPANGLDSSGFSSNTAAQPATTFWESLEVDRLAGPTSVAAGYVVVVTESAGDTGRRIPLESLRGSVTSLRSTFSREHHPAVSPAASVSDMLACVRTAFSLNVKQLAQTMGVERPTIYTWIRDEGEPRPDNLRHLRAVWELAELWLKLARRPIGKLLQAVVVDDQSVLDLLVAKPLRTHVLQEQLRRISDQLAPTPPGKGRGGRRAAELLKMEIGETRASERIAFETGQRTSPE